MVIIPEAAAYLGSKLSEFFSQPNTFCIITPLIVMMTVTTIGSRPNMSMNQNFEKYTKRNIQFLFSVFLSFIQYPHNPALIVIMITNGIGPDSNDPSTYCESDVGISN